MTADRLTGPAPEQPALVVTIQPRDPAAGLWCDLESWPAPAGEILVVRVSGELDLLTRPILAATLVEAVSRGSAHLVVDLAGTTFCCVRGFGMLAETGFTASARGASFALSGLSTHRDRILAMLLPDRDRVRYRSVAAAVTAIRGGRSRPNRS